MTITTESYDALGTLLPAEPLKVVSSFACNWKDDVMPERIVLGLWVESEDGTVAPRYLSAAQRDSAFK